LSAPYITAQRKNLQQSHAVEDYEADLPIPQHTSPDSTVRIPLEMFPPEQQAMRYFQYFFDNIHPYCPVVSQVHFMHQWHTDKDSISALLLEAIFACASTQLDGQQEGVKWLALASSKSTHLNNFELN
jgi:hypothetical protein